MRQKFRVQIRGSWEPLTISFLCFFVLSFGARAFATVFRRGSHVYKTSHQLEFMTMERYERQIGETRKNRERKEREREFKL